ncbi:MAG: flagellar hook protein FlgE [Oxalobacteraceae bacterium]|nr:flagellar hook protein FlgE [Oxalobacteraceae bacterium]
MSFQQGLSGLNAASKNLEVIGNNVANSSTVGFKQSQAQFADVFANSLTGAGASQIGIGTKLNAVVQQYTQGNVTASNNPLDIAINGGGFFVMDVNGAPFYSRNGQFQLNKEGYIVNASGARLTGYSVDSNGDIPTSGGTPEPLKISAGDLAPRPTGGVMPVPQTLPPKSTEPIQALLNLNSGSVSPSAVAPVTFNHADPKTYNDSTSVSVFDSLGNLHILQTYYVKDPTAAGTWEVFGVLDPDLIGSTSVSVGTLTFDSSGKLVTSPSTTTAIGFPAYATGGVDPNLIIDFEGTTQFGSKFSVNKLTQDGFSSGRLSGFTTESDGTITGNYTNGNTATLGKVALASFANPNGLQSLGNNLWAATAASGNALVGSPNSGSLGVLQSSAVEDSNVDLTAELVNMITAQRIYQANAQTIKTQDQVMQTLVNLR